MNKPELILLIDDDEINNFINEAILKLSVTDTRIISYLDPIKANQFLLEDYIHNPVPAIIFLDINMPQMSGWEILENLEKHIDIVKESLSVFMISSSIDSSDRDKSLKSSLVKDFVSKPLSKEFVQNLLQNYKENNNA
ncbi:MAG: response regulator [Leptospiraceae bacterium]|nr:response regulator [Leptospiraceae bacterium]